MPVRVEARMLTNVGSVRVPPLQNIGVVKVPTPFFIGRLNTYVTLGEPIALIDVGVNSPQAKEGLIGGLKELGITPDKIGRIIITHPHQDHCGMVAWLKELNPNIETIVSAEEADFCENYFEEFNDTLDYIDKEYHLCGFDKSLADGIVAIRRNHLEHCAPFEVSRRVAEGDEIKFNDFKLKVMSTPGHTEGSISLVYGDDRRRGPRTIRSGCAIFTGDFIYPGRV